MEKYLGVRHDPLSQKQERANVAETNASTAPFDAFEKRGFKSRVKGIKEYNQVFDNGKDKIRNLNQVSNLEIDRYYRVPEPDRGYQHCDKCGNEIEVGENFYTVSIGEGETI
ncbi:817_t:CDS:2 [Racocetra fulgida]|uniref:817_t:CDS:1 n=1 Tax=Racocetra fulgida TaxID=60492 RepID=A0A9N8YTL1_9GLOM|nr:817_t:CDS:2 [Racocetra fulgida]